MNVQNESFLIISEFLWSFMQKGIGMGNFSFSWENGVGSGK